MFTYLPNFNPLKRKPAISVCGPYQLIVNIRESSQHHNNGRCRFLQNKVSELYIVNDIFWQNFFGKIAKYMPKLLRKKFEIKILIINRTVAMYMWMIKRERFDPLVLTGVRVINFLNFANFNLIIFTQHSYTGCLPTCWSVCLSCPSVLCVCLYVCLSFVLKVCM